MSEKRLTGLAAAAAVLAPVCALCILGPVLLGSAVAWVTGWFNGLDPFVTAGLAIIAGGALYGLVRWRRVKVDAANLVAVPVSRKSDSETQ